MRFSSGELNAKQREILELQALAQRRLKATQANFADGVRAAKEVKRDLDWTQKRVSYVLFLFLPLQSLHHSPPFSKIQGRKEYPSLRETEITPADD